ncbi:MAG: HAD hydrolase-like protein [Clostridia bacterium]|nr:HAD hydrolase-like protein [Clostridia bacterium]
MKKYIVDLDNTLVFTNRLNNEAYNYALYKIGKRKIKSTGRITRQEVFRSVDLTEKEKEKLVKIKQDYFINNLDKIEVNQKLLALLEKAGRENSVLWTRAEPTRVKPILLYYDLRNKFSYIYYSEKKELQKDMDHICTIVGCDNKELIIFDDELNAIKGKSFLEIKKTE